MAGVNKVILVGRLGKDPEVRSFNNGGQVVSLSIATSETWKDKDGERQERTEWHRVSIFNEKLGEIAERYLRKGSEVYIEGQIETRKWQDQSGQDRYSTEVVVRPYRGELCLIGGRKDDDRAERRDDRPERRDERRDDRRADARRDDRGGFGGRRDEPRRDERAGRAQGGWGGADRRGADLDDDIPF